MSEITQAVDAIKRGDVAVFKTETVYGLGADATKQNAVEQIFHYKKRPLHNPLIVHVASLTKAEELGDFSPLAKRLAETFWPGALTLVLPRKPGPLTDVCCADLPTVALRVPSYPLALRFLEACGMPIAAPSANISGYLSPTHHTHIPFKSLPIVGRGTCPLGLESTICMPHKNAIRILREGLITQEAIATLCKTTIFRPKPFASSPPKVLSPGMLLRHYATTTPLRINARTVREGEGLVLFGKAHFPKRWQECHHRNLSPSGSLQEACGNLFQVLYELDHKNVPSIAVMPIPSEGEGRALNDRLKRAANGSFSALSVHSA